MRIFRTSGGNRVISASRRHHQLFFLNCRMSRSGIIPAAAALCCGRKARRGSRGGRYKRADLNGANMCGAEMYRTSASVRCILLSNWLIGLSYRLALHSQVSFNPPFLLELDQNINYLCFSLWKRTNSFTGKCISSRQKVARRKCNTIHKK